MTLHSPVGGEYPQDEWFREYFVVDNRKTAWYFFAIVIGDLPMPVPPQEDVRAIVESVRAQITNIVLGGWDDWRNSTQVGTWRCKRSRANFVWEQIIDRAHKEFDEISHVRVLEGHETFKFLVGDQVLFRFKKADDAGSSANIPTQLALAYHDHEKDLFGLPEVYRVEIVYQLNQLETEITDILVAARNEDKLAWSYSLLDRSEGIIPLPTPEPSDLPKPAVRLVRAREDEAPGEQKQRD